jgi:hypothetical protein
MLEGLVLYSNVEEMMRRITRSNKGNDFINPLRSTPKARRFPLNSPVEQSSLSIEPQIFHLDGYQVLFIHIVQRIIYSRPPL